MLSDKRLERYAGVLLWALKTARGKRYQKNDIVMIRFDLAAIGLAEVLQSILLDMGINPALRLMMTRKMEHAFYGKSNRKQLIFQPPGEKELYQKLNGGIYLFAPESLTHLSDIDPVKIGKAAVARKPLRDILDKREAKRDFGWCLCMLPTPALARHAKISLKQYTSQVIRACYLDKADPVQEWRKIYEKAKTIKKWLNGLKIKSIHIESENIDLKVAPGQRRKWIGISGHNIPSFEIFISPDWRGTEGIYYANQPSFRSGNRVEGVRLTFRKGNVVKVKSKRGEHFVEKQVSMDQGAKRVGEFSLTDKRFSRINRFMANTLYDENFGGPFGNCHLALGASYSDTYDGDPGTLSKERKKKLGLNDSALHWDLVNTEKKTVTAQLTSGQKVVIYRNGMFQY